MSQRLLFPDAPTAADVLTFSARVARLGDGAVRLKATGGTLLPDTCGGGASRVSVVSKELLCPGGARSAASNARAISAAEPKRSVASVCVARRRKS